MYNKFVLFYDIRQKKRFDCCKLVVVSQFYNWIQCIGVVIAGLCDCLENCRVMLHYTKPWKASKVLHITDESEKVRLTAVGDWRQLHFLLYCTALHCLIHCRSLHLIIYCTAPCIAQDLFLHCTKTFAALHYTFYCTVPCSTLPHLIYTTWF